MDNLTVIKTEELKQIISDIVETQINKLQQPTPKPDYDDLIKAPDVAKLFKVSLVTVNDWKKSGKIPFYRIANKVFFRKSELLESMKKNVVRLRSSYVS
jgi:hypothetical protein